MRIIRWPRSIWLLKVIMGEPDDRGQMTDQKRRSSPRTRIGAKLERHDCGTDLPPPLWGRVGEGGRSWFVWHVHARQQRPPPPSPPPLWGGESIAAPLSL